MQSTRQALATAAGAVLLVIAVTAVQGVLTERWGRREDGGRLARAAGLLEESFPRKFGDWEFEEVLPSDPQELARAGAVGHVSKLYRNARTKTHVSTFVVCATPHDASGHTPDRCYPGAGFEIGEAEHRHPIGLRDGREAETFTATFRKQGQTLRIFWTYGIAEPADGNARPGAEPDNDGIASAETRLRWIAPGIARIALAGQPAVYKVYAIVDQTKMTTSQATAEGTDFLAQLLTSLDDEITLAKQAGDRGLPAGDGDATPGETGPVGEPTSAGDVSADAGASGLASPTS
jgi:hypothetical protein